MKLDLLPAVATLLFATFVRNVLAGSLEQFNPNSAAPGETSMRAMEAAAVVCHSEILRRVGQGKVFIMGPCKNSHDGSVGGIAHVSNGYVLKFEVSDLNSSRMGQLIGEKKDVIVTCQTDTKGRIVAFSDRPAKVFFERDRSGLCLGQGQLF